MSPAIRFTPPWAEADEEGNIDTWPGKYVICERCRGTGQHTNPAIDGHGLSAEEMDEWSSPDWDFREEYMRGTYDIPCEEKCEGGKKLVPDEDRLTPEQKQEWEDWLRDEAESRAIDRAEARAFGYY